MQETYAFPLVQGIGAPSVPVVEVGDEVERGQKIAAIPEGKLGSNIHSSVSGTVEAVTDVEIVVRASASQPEGWARLSSKAPLDLIKESGLVGLGGAGFPTYVKLAKPFEGGGTVIVNAAECEPILGHNIERIEERPGRLVRGLEIAMELAQATEGVVAIKGSHAKAIEALKGVLGPKMRVELLKEIYPVGEERALVREILGVLLPPTALPMEAKAIVINAETACRIVEAVDERKPLIDKDMTVAGKLDGPLIQTFFDVPIGTTVGSMLERAGGVSAKDHGELIMGGPFTGKRTYPDRPVVKTCGGILVAEAFWKGPERIGLLVCACGADRERLEQIAESMGSRPVGVEYCKQAQEVKGVRKCEDPGICPGQVQKVMALKKAGAQALLISNCTDCTNTVMSCAPQLKLPVYHCTDGPLRAVNMKLVRKIKTA